MNVQQHAEDYT